MNAKYSPASVGSLLGNGVASGVIGGIRRSLKNSGSHIDASHSRQPLVKGERLVCYEVNAVILRVAQPAGHAIRLGEASVHRAPARTKSTWQARFSKHANVNMPSIALGRCFDQVLAFIAVWCVLRFVTKKGLRDRNSPTCTLSQNGYGTSKSAPVECIATCSKDALMPRVRV